MMYEIPITTHSQKQQMQSSIFNSLTSGIKFNSRPVNKKAKEERSTKLEQLRIELEEKKRLEKSEGNNNDEDDDANDDSSDVDDSKNSTSARSNRNSSSDEGNETRKRGKNGKKEDMKKRKRVESMDGDDEENVLFSSSVRKSSTDRNASKSEAPETEKEERSTDYTFVREQLKIKVSGLSKGQKVVPPNPILQFSELLQTCPKKHTEIMLRNIELSKYKEPTPVQMQAIPCMINGMDIMTCAPTGSGKTAAYLIPTFFLLEKLRLNKVEGIKCIIIVPTRELSSQIMREIKRLFDGYKYHAAVLRDVSAKASTSIDQFASEKFDVLITTPLRLVHSIKNEDIKLDNVHSLILDEADKLFELGFLEQVDEIIAACKNVNIQRSLWSATMPPKIDELARSILRDAIKISIGATNSGADTIEQKLQFVGDEDGKIHALRQLISEGKIKPPAMLFLQSKEKAKQLQSELAFDGLKIDCMHGERTQLARDLLVQQFREGKIWFLLSSDILARGIDFKAVNTVVNIDFPQDIVTYIHRIGRTGRAGRKGTAITFFTIDDIKYLRSIANVMRISGCDVPEWMLQLKKEKRKSKKFKKTN